MTLEQFGQRVGISFAYASRLKNGNRLPGAHLMDRIAREFKIPPKMLMQARRDGPEAFSRLLRERVYGEREERSA